ncbi:MAG: response regulator [Chloroflexi bacterium]|nr:response regulator [Ktedonobacteraceae bacterium]MBV9021268.1 response regulator [Ktedonobacteraceae bacterium]MBV9707536.1 response regulator [Chloroflexota bacterium]
MHTPRILLVDDDLALLEALPHMIALQVHGVVVDTSVTALGALEQIQEHDYDAIVSDIKMPGMDGLELLTKIQELQPEVPTLLITGHADQTLITQALRGGAYDFIHKPIDRVAFVASLHRAIQTRELRRRVHEQQRALEQHAHSLEHLIEKRTRELLAASEAMELLVRDLLDISRIESDRLFLHPRRCDLIELCQHVLHAYTVGAGLALSFTSTELSLEVEVDRDRLSQVLINLLFTARKCSPRGSPITIMLQHVGDEAIITVTERSESGPEETIPEEFTHVYSRGEAVAYTDVSAQAGLGLYLAQKLVEQHGGRIQAQRDMQTGCTFSIILPVPALPTAELPDESRHTGKHPTPFHPPQWLIS